MNSIALSQALAFAAQNAPAAGTPGPERQLETALHAFWAQWAQGLAGAHVARQATMRSPSWPGVGKVDLALVSPAGGEHGGRLWIEVKWHDLWNCPWDVAKLALALREGLCDHAMLVAAAPAGKWSGPGGEFFAPATWDMATDVLDAHRASWLFWKKEVKTRPLRLPASVRTEFASRPQPLGRGWSLRAIALAVDRSGWVTVDEDRRARPEPESG